MVRFSPRPLRALAATLLLTFAGLAFAQDSNAAVRAVLGFTNLLDPMLVTELQSEYSEAQDLALALLEELEAVGILSPAVVSSMEFAILAVELPCNTFVVFLDDLANGTAPAAAGVEEAAVQLDAISPSLAVPVGADCILSEEDVASIITYVAEDTDGLLAAIQEGYDAAITPTTG